MRMLILFAGKKNHIHNLLFSIKMITNYYVRMEFFEGF